MEHDCGVDLLDDRRTAQLDTGAERVAEMHGGIDEPARFREIDLPALARGRMGIASGDWGDIFQLRFLDVPHGGETEIDELGRRARRVVTVSAPMLAVECLHGPV